MINGIRTNKANRIDEKLDSLKQKNEKALIAFVTAGDPNLATTIELVHAMESAGADLIELGIPYSDPLADGVTIQESSARALQNGAKIKNIMSTVKTIREKSNIPLLYLAYYNSVYKYGMDQFLAECAQVGIDGVIIPDLPIEERSDIAIIASENDVHLIPLVAPTSGDRIKAITENGKGFVYCVSTTGVTGVRNQISTDIEGYIKTVSGYTQLPKALGFGISSPEMAAAYKDYCDAIIVGSAIVKKIAEAKDNSEAVASVSSLVAQLKMAIL